MLQVETFGNAIVQFRKGAEVLLTCDPWIEGTAYFGSWGIEAPLSPAQKTSVLQSKYIWISHGHPDHMHPESLKLIPRATAQILLPDHYDSGIGDFLTGEGFRVQILRYKEWTELDANLKVLCIDNENQDAILIAKFGDMLVINQNDSPTCGEQYFLKRLVREHPNDKTILAALCAVDADMLNIVDAEGSSLAGDLNVRKKGAVWTVSSYAAKLGVRHFCCSSSQHVYLRPDSAWANPYRIDFQDMREHWIRPSVQLHEPYQTIDVEPLRFAPNDPKKTDITNALRESPVDDWDARLSEEEWKLVAAFVARFNLIKNKFDFISFRVGHDRRDFSLGKVASSARGARGIVFTVPKEPLMETVGSGYFDDLLIGNFMKTELVNATLYPNFTPRVAKLAGNAQVFTHRQHMRFLLRYFRRNPRAFLGARVDDWWGYLVLPGIRSLAETLGLKYPLKAFYRRILLRHPT